MLVHLLIMQTRGLQKFVICYLLLKYLAKAHCINSYDKDNYKFKLLKDLLKRNKAF